MCNSRNSVFLNSCAWEQQECIKTKKREKGYTRVSMELKRPRKTKSRRPNYSSGLPYTRARYARSSGEITYQLAHVIDPLPPGNKRAKELGSTLHELDEKHAQMFLSEAWIEESLQSSSVG